MTILMRRISRIITMTRVVVTANIAATIADIVNFIS